MKLIDKDALVAEIERRNEESWLGHYTKEKGIVFDITDDILSFIDTLEVKEIDLEKEIEKYLSTYWPKEKELHPFLGHMAKHFFELGMQVSNKSQKGEDA